MSVHFFGHPTSSRAHNRKSVGAWAETLAGDSGVRFLSDPQAEFTKALELEFEGAAVFLGPRSKRYAIVVEDGKVKELHVEPDNTGVNGRLSTMCPLCTC